MIFLSHSWKNKPAARKLVEALAEQKVPCWLDEQQLDEGVELRASLRDAISQSDVYLYLISCSANQSEWVQGRAEVRPQFGTGRKTSHRSRAASPITMILYLHFLQAVFAEPLIQQVVARLTSLINFPNLKDIAVFQTTVASRPQFALRNTV